MIDQGISTEWWAEKAADARLTSVSSVYRRLRDTDERIEAYRAFDELYTNRDLSGPDTATYIRALTGQYGTEYSRVPINVIKQAIDTWHGRVAKIKHRPTFLTNSGNFSLQRRAKLMQRYIDAQFDDLAIYTLGPRVMKDCMKYGTGAMKIYRDGDDVKVERVYPGELLVDPHEAFHTDNVRQLFQSKYVPRYVLKKMFPKMAKQIDSAANVATKNFADLGYDSTIDQVEVIEAWHLESVCEAEDGRHMIFIDGVTLLDEPYDYHDFPFVFCRWDREPRGFFGIGLAEDLIGLHVDINVTMEKINRGHELAVSPLILVGRNSGMTAAKITDVPGQVLEVDDVNGVKFLAPNGVNPVLYNHLENLKAEAYRTARLNDLALMGQTPSGLQTGAAVRSWHDVGSEGAAIVSAEYQTMLMKVAEHVIRVTKEIADDTPNYRIVASKDRNTIDDIDWADVDLEADAYVLRIYPASSLPNSVSGKLAAVGDMMNMQLISPPQARNLLDFPDLDTVVSLEAASENAIRRAVELMLDDGKPQSPEEFLDLTLAIKICQAEVLNAQARGVPEAHISMVRRYALQCSALMRKAKQAAAEQQAAQQMAMAQPAPGALA